jgi:chlorophyll/bacteriochlorophyll a synthase
MGSAMLEYVSESNAGVMLQAPCHLHRLSCPQTINDYFDRELDAINEPYRPIPSGLHLVFASYRQWQLLTAADAACPIILKLPRVHDAGAISEPEVITQFLTLLVAGLGVSYTLDR